MLKRTSLLLVFYCLAIALAAIGRKTRLARGYNNDFSKTDLSEELLTIIERARIGNFDNLPFLFPALNIITLPSVAGTYESRGIRITYSTSDLEVFGLSEFRVDSLKASRDPMEASLDFTIPNVTVYADAYKIKGRALLYPLKGAGHARAIMKSILGHVGIALSETESGHIKIDSLMINYDVDNIKVDLEHISWIIKEIINVEAADFVNSNREYLQETLRTSVVPQANDYLSQVTPAQMWHTITNLARDGTT